MDPIQYAMDCVNNSRRVAEKCPYRPIYHFLSPANWMNDPNGTIFINGEYHLFYQHNPFKPKWNHIHWGHAKSKDLIHWEHLPLALAPSIEKGEKYCFSGCCVNDNECPTIIYTKIGKLREILHGAEQWMATSDIQMIQWKKFFGNPIMDDSLHGNLKVWHWRDPYVWKEGDEWYCVLGGHFRWKRRGCIFLYKSRDLRMWEYLGVLYQGNKSQGWNFECPNFFQLNNKYILIISPHGKVIYGIGSYLNRKFFPEEWHLMDHSKQYYATNTLIDEKGRIILFGFIRVRGRGWTNCISLPRILSLDKKAQLCIKPLPELQILRQKFTRWQEMKIQETTEIELLPKFGGSLEIICKFDVKVDVIFYLKIGKEKKDKIFEFNTANAIISLGKEKGSLSRVKDDSSLIFHIYLDKSVIEVFVNNKECITGHFYPKIISCPLVIGSEKGEININSLEIWNLKSIW